MRVCVLICILLALSLSVFAEDFFNDTNPGAANLAVGEACVGSALGPEAIINNPGGLYQSALLTVTATYQRPWMSVIEKHSSYAHTSKCDDTNLGYTGVTVPLRCHNYPLVIGVAARREYDDKFHYQWRLYSAMDDGDYTYNHWACGGVNEYSVALGSLIGPFGVGFALNFRGGEQDYDSYYTTPWENMVSREFYHMDYSGTNLTLGTHIDLSRINPGFPVFCGVTVQTPYDLKSDCTGQNIDEYLSREITTQMPWKFTAGTVIRLRSNLTFLADIQEDLYRGSESNRILYNEPDHINRPLSGHHFFQYRIGAEYRLCNAANNLTVPLRIGFQNYPTDLCDKDAKFAGFEAYYLGKQVVGHSVCFGAGLEYGKATLDCAYVLRSAKQNVYENGTPGTFAYQIHILSVTLSLHL